MPDVVHVSHPAPVVMVPSRSRNERLVFVRETTPATLREVPRRSIRKFFDYRGKGPSGAVSLYEHDGGLWRQAGAGRAVDGRQAVDAAAWRAFLEGGADEAGRFTLGDSLDFHLARTPLVAIHLSDGKYIHRGLDADVAGARRVVHDGRPRAKADLLRFLEDEVVLCEGRPFVRLRGPLLFANLRWAPYEGSPDLVMYLDKGWDRTTRTEMALPARLDRWQGLWRLIQEARYPYVPNPDRPPVMVEEDRHEETSEIAKLIREVDHAMFGDADVLAMANLAPARLMRRYRLDAWDGVPALAEMAGRLRPWEGIGSLGGVRPEEAEEVLLMCRDFIQAARDVVRMPVDLDLLLAYIDRFALPLVSRPDPIAGEDADAFGALAPGGMR